MQDCFESYTAASQKRAVTSLTQPWARQHQGFFIFVSFCVFTLHFSSYRLSLTFLQQTMLSEMTAAQSTIHNTQLHTWQPSCFGIWRRTFFFFFCRFQSFETLNRDFLAATYRRKQTKYVDHFMIYLKIVLILISHSKKKIRALIWIKFTIKRTWKCRPQIWRERRSRHAWLWRLTLYLSYQSCFCEVKLRLDWKHTEGEVQLMTWKSVKVVWKEKNSVLGGPWRLPRILGKKRKRKGNNNEFFKSTTLKCNSAEGGKSGGGAPPFKKWWLSKQSSGGGALLELSMALNLWSLIV